MLQIEDASIAYGDEILFSKFNLQLKKEGLLAFRFVRMRGNISSQCHTGFYSVKRRTYYSQ